MEHAGGRERRYLLSIEEFLAEESGGRLMEEAFLKVDSERRGRAERMRTGRARAASLGAGLLLQLAVQEAVRSGGRELTVQEAAVSGGELTVQEAAVSGGELVVQEAAVSGGEPSVREAAVSGGRELTVQEMPENGGGQQAKAAGGTDKQNPACQYMKHELTQYTVSQAMEMISAPCSVFYRYGKNGKPYFQELPFFFNLSHSGNYVFCALSLSEIGADIQQHGKRGRERIADRFFSKEEAALFRSRQDDEAFFFRLWARKEAYGKLTGEGIPGAVGVNLLPGVPPPGSRELIWEEYEEIGGYSLSVCRYRPGTEGPEQPALCRACKADPWLA